MRERNHGIAPRRVGRQVGLRLLASSGSNAHVVPLSVAVPFFWSPFFLSALAAFLPRHRPAAPETPPRPDPASGAAGAECRRVRYLVIVEREEAALCEYLQRRFAGDAEVRVFTDRRRAAEPGTPKGDRRRARSGGDRPFCWIVEATSEDGPIPARQRPNNGPSPEEERRGFMEELEERQRVDRWIEESQYLIGRMIPGLLDDRERLRGKLETAEQECARLRQEISELRKEVGDLQGETQFFRTEHVAMAEALREVIDLVGQVQKPLNDVFRRLQVTQPALGATA